MIHTTLGLDIGTRAIRYALCQVDGQKISIKAANAIEFEIADEPVISEEKKGTSLPVKTDESNPVSQALAKVTAQLSGHSKVPIDAIGMTVDPSYELSTHRILPFNDPRMIAQVLKLQLNDIWTIDDNAQLSFKIGAFIENKAEAESEDAAAPMSGYDVYVINYPKDKLLERINQAKFAHIEPHLMLPSNEALPHLFQTVLDTDQNTFILLDIGEHVSTLTVISNNKTELSRSFKLGGATIDELIAEACGISHESARLLKEASGFVSEPGRELETYQNRLASHDIQPVTTADPAVIAKCCSNGLNMLVSAIRQTLLQFVAKTRIEPTIMCITGGSSNLPGIEKWFEQNLEVQCTKRLPYDNLFISQYNSVNEFQYITLDAIAAAVAAARNIDDKLTLNLRHGDLAHKGSLAFIQENKWLLLALVVAIIASLIFMTVTRSKMIKQEHDKVLASLEKTSQDVFGKKLTTYQQIQNEIAQSKGYNFIPEKTAFTHFMWISNQVNDNLSDVEMDFSQLDIDIQRKIVTIRGEVTGDEGLPKFMQLMEQYECFPDEIQEPKTSKNKDRVTFTLRIEANHCGSGDDSE